MSSYMSHTKKELVEMIERMDAEMEQITSELAALRAEHAEIAETHERLKAELEELREEAREREESLSEGYAVFKSFVDDHKDMVVLVDATYTIRYVNNAAGQHLKLPTPYAIVGRRIFDFFEYREALKLKERIDHTFLTGEKGKIKDLRFQNLKQETFLLKLKMSRVRYEDMPSIKMALK